MPDKAYNPSDIVFKLASSGIHLFLNQGVLYSVGTTIRSEQNVILDSKPALIEWLRREVFSIKHTMLAVETSRRLLAALHSAGIDAVQHLQASRPIEAAIDAQDPVLLRRSCTDAVKVMCPGSDMLRRY